MVRVLRWLDCTGEDGKSATSVGLKVAMVLLRLG